MYAARKIRDTFRANRSTRDFAEIDRQMAEGQQNLELIRRQVSGPSDFTPLPYQQCLKVSRKRKAFRLRDHSASKKSRRIYQVVRNSNN